MKTVSEAAPLRNHVLGQLALAASADHPAIRAAALTFVLVGRARWAAAGPPADTSGRTQVDADLAAIGVPGVFAAGGHRSGAGPEPAR